MTTTKPENWDFTKISNSVKQQLIGNNAVQSKATQLGISDDEVSNLLDSLIAEWLRSYRKNRLEYKSLTGWILCESVKKQFLNI